MGIEDLIQDIEGTKLASIGLFGFATGALAALIKFDEKIEKKSKQMFSSNPKVEKQGIKYFIACAAGIPSVDYGTGLNSSLGQAGVYITEYRLAYEIGNRLINKYIR